MILKFTFNTVLRNGLIEKIFLREAKKFEVEIGFKRDLKHIFVYVKGEEKSVLEFVEVVSKELPLSVFLYSVKAEVSEEFKSESIDFLDVFLPPCPKCIREVKDKNSKFYYNIFHHCEVCGYGNDEVSRSFEKEIKKLAKKLKEEGEIFIQTMNGKYRISSDLRDSEYLLALDLAAVSKYFFSFEGDAKALGSIEKPYLRLKPNLNFKKKFEFSYDSFFVKLPDCMVLELLAYELQDMGVLSLQETDEAYDFEFEVDNPYNPLYAVVTDTKDKDVLIVKGDRGILPVVEDIAIKEEGVNGRYRAYFKDNKTILDIADEEINIKKRYEGFVGVVKEWQLEDKVTVGFSFYKRDESFILLNSKKFGLIEYMSFDFDFKSFEEIFAFISVMDEKGKKLLENFKKREKELFEQVLQTPLKSDLKGMAYLWGVVGVIIGIDREVNRAYEKILYYSSSVVSKKGPRIDYKVTTDRGINPFWVIRTAISFKLAGVDNYLLSLGILESFSEFLVDRYEELAKESEIDGSVIVGDLFEGELLNKLYTSLKKNYDVYTPRGLQISGAIEALGDAVIKAL